MTVHHTSGPLWRPSPEELALIGDVRRQLDRQRLEHYDSSYEVVLHPDDLPGAVAICSFPIVRDDVMPRMSPLVLPVPAEFR